MTWYAACAIMYVKFKDGNQDKYPVWENIILIEASSSNEAWNKAAIRAKEDEDENDCDLLWGDRPAMFVFAGIRKIVLCVNAEDRPTDGTEITYSQMEIDSWESLEKFLKGEDIFLKYDY